MPNFEYHVTNWAITNTEYCVTSDPVLMHKIIKELLTGSARFGPALTIYDIGIFIQEKE